MMSNNAMQTSVSESGASITNHSSALDQVENLICSSEFVLTVNANTERDAKIYVCEAYYFTFEKIGVNSYSGVMNLLLTWGALIWGHIELF